MTVLAAYGWLLVGAILGACARELVTWLTERREADRECRRRSDRAMNDLERARMRRGGRTPA